MGVCEYVCIGVLKSVRWVCVQCEVGVCVGNYVEA